MLQQKPRLEIDAKYLPLIQKDDKVLKINAEGLYYRELNALLRQAICAEGLEKIEIHNVCGQRYIGTDLDTNIQIDIYGTPGNDLGAFMNGPKVSGSRQRTGRLRQHNERRTNNHKWPRRRRNRTLNERRKNLCPRLRRLQSRHTHERIPNTKSPK